MISNRYKATCILGVVTVGFFISYCFQDTFIGGLLAGGFGAAMIGGMADWFAVSALFRRPLGIPFRTAIVPRNRAKIFQALTNMVENQLLMKENIKSRFNECDMSATLVTVMIEYGGKNIVKRMLYSFIREILAQVEPKALGRMIDGMIKDIGYKTQIVLYIIAGAEWLIKHNYDDKLIRFCLKQCILLAKHKQVTVFFAQCFISARQRYEQGMMRRKYFNQILKLSAEQVGNMGQQALLTALTVMQDDEHAVRQNMKVRLQQWLIAKKTDSLFQEKFEKWVYQLLGQAEFMQCAVTYVTNFCGDAIADNRQTVKWLELFIRQLEKGIADFAQNEHERANFDTAVKNMLGNWLDTYHHEIGKTVTESLNTFTDEMLIEFIESKIGNDLQMIRINGSVVGGLVGMILYVATFWL